MSETRILLDLPAQWDALKWATQPGAVCADYLQDADPIDYWYVEKDQDIKERYGVYLCFTCPLRRPCLEHALTRPEKEGTWGGTSKWQRIRFFIGPYRREEMSLDQAMELSEEYARKSGIVRGAA